MYTHTQASRHKCCIHLYVYTQTIYINIYTYPQYICLLNNKDILSV